MDTSVCQNLNCDGLELWTKDMDSAKGNISQRCLAMCTVQWVSEATESADCAQSVTITLNFKCSTYPGTCSLDVL